jgi:hypothetical protein
MNKKQTYFILTLIAIVNCFAIHFGLKVETWWGTPSNPSNDIVAALLIIISGCADIICLVFSLICIYERLGEKRSNG